MLRTDASTEGLGRPAALLALAACLLMLAATVGHPAEGASTSPAPSSSQPKTIVILGDSLAAGYGVDAAEAFPALLQQKIDAAGWRFQVVDAGVSGDTSAGGLRRVDWLLKRRVDVLIVELGGNDGLRGIPVGSTLTNLSSIIEHTRQKYPSTRFVVAGMQMPPNLGEDYNTAFQAMFPAVAKATRAELIPFLLEGVGGRPELNQPDGIHPTAEGHKIVADNVWRILRPLLEKINAPSP